MASGNLRTLEADWLQRGAERSQPSPPPVLMRRFARPVRSYHTSPSTRSLSRSLSSSCSFLSAEWQNSTPIQVPRLRREGIAIGERARASTAIPWRRIPAFNSMGSITDTGVPEHGSRSLLRTGAFSARCSHSSLADLWTARSLSTLEEAPTPAALSLGFERKRRAAQPRPASDADIREGWLELNRQRALDRRARQKPRSDNLNTSRSTGSLELSGTIFGADSRPAHWSPKPTRVEVRSPSPYAWNETMDEVMEAPASLSPPLMRRGVRAIAPDAAGVRTGGLSSAAFYPAHPDKLGGRIGKYMKELVEKLVAVDTISDKSSEIVRAAPSYESTEASLTHRSLNKATAFTNSSPNLAKVTEKKARAWR